MARFHVQLFALVVLVAVVAGYVADMPDAPDSEEEDSDLSLVRALRGLSDTDVKRLQRRGWWRRGRNSVRVSASQGNGVNGAYTYTNGGHTVNAGVNSNGGASLGYSYSWGKKKKSVK